MASPTACSGVYRQSKTLRHAWLPALEDVTTLHRSCLRYIGYQCDSGLNVSSLSWSSRLSAWHRGAAGAIMFCWCYFLFFFICRPSHSTTGGRIATRIVALTSPMKKLLRLQMWWTFGPVTPEILWLICMGWWVHRWHKYALFGCFHQNVWIYLRKTFRKYIEG